MTATLPTKTELRKMPKAELLSWATGLCLLEHLDTAEAEAMTKTALLNEVSGALLRIEVEEDHRAMATDTQARSAEELLGLAEPAAEAEAPQPASTEGSQICKGCAEDLPVTKFPTKAAYKGVIARADTCRSCRDAARAARKAAV